MPRELGRAAAVLAGSVLYALAFPPVDWGVFGWLTLVPLLLVLRSCSVSSGFAYGLLYGCTIGWTATGWALAAVGRYFGLPLPLAVLGLTLFYAVVSAPTFGLFGAGAALLLRSRGRRARYLVVPALWVGGELIRTRLIGQPWVLLGYSQHGQVALIQLAALTGVYGVSFVLALGSVAIAETAAALFAGARPRCMLTKLALPAATIGIIWAAGALVAERGPEGGFSARPVTVVQANVAPAFRWTRGYAERQLMAHVRATDGVPVTSRRALIVWPENAITQYLESDTMLAGQLADLARRHEADLLFGAPRYEEGRTYSSVRLITADGKYGGHYDKQHLVLFAEAGLLAAPPPAAASESPRQFSAGSVPGVLQSFVPVGVSICHEILYPELVSQTVRAGAQLLVSVSNDGWLDGGSGIASRQHFAMAVFRAVESRRYLVRGATTGVSGVVDPHGRVLEALAPHTAGVVTSSVAGRSYLTPYVRLGDVFGLGCLGVAMAALVGRRRGLLWRRRHRFAPASAAPASPRSA